MRLSFVLRNFVFGLILWNSFLLNSDSSFALNQTCTNQILERLLQAPPVNKQDFAVVDIGSSSVKLLIKKGTTGEIISDSYRIDLGKSLGETGEISEQAYQSLKTALAKTETKLNAYGIHPSKIKTVATAGIRDANNRTEIVQRLSSEGYRLRVLSEEEESKYVYQSILRNQKLPKQGAVVVEVGGGSTEIVKGLDLFNIEAEKSSVIRAGSGSLGIKNPFNIDEINLARLKTRAMLRDKKVVLDHSESGLDGYIGQSFPFRTLREIHLQRTGVDLFKTGLTDETIDFYLSEKGLATLKQTTKYSLNKNSINGINDIPSKLLVLDEVKNHFHIANIKFGAKGGMKEAIVAEIELANLSKKIDRTSHTLIQNWNRSYDHVMENLTNTFDPEVFGVFEFRLKGNESLASKFTSKWVKDKISSEELGRTKRAQTFIGDGIGGRLTLESATTEDSQQFYSTLLSAIQERKINVKEIHNYRAANGIPYFTDQQVEELSRVIKTTTGKKPEITIGTKAEKPSGYTALHLNIMDESGVPFEFQVRGKSVSEIAEREHIFYDMRQGKASGPNLTDKQSDLFLSYIRECYHYARKTELNQTASIPKFPKELKQFSNLSMDAPSAPVH